VDTDPIAIDATIANAGRNALAGRVAARHGSLPSDEAPFDVILANLIASVLVTLAPLLREELRPGGTVLASGIFIDREDEVRTAFDAAGLAVRRAVPKASGSRSRRSAARSSAVDTTVG
jgi:ribosomal protein L11 methyltransferase